MSHLFYTTLLGQFSQATTFRIFKQKQALLCNFLFAPQIRGNMLDYLKGSFSCRSLQASHQVVTPRFPVSPHHFLWPTYIFTSDRMSRPQRTGLNTLCKLSQGRTCSGFSMKLILGLFLTQLLWRCGHTLVKRSMCLHLKRVNHENLGLLEFQGYFFLDLGLSKTLWRSETSLVSQEPLFSSRSKLDFCYYSEMGLRAKMWKLNVGNRNKHGAKCRKQKQAGRAMEVSRPGETLRSAFELLVSGVCVCACTLQ